ncbi:MAG: hypothetical protein Q8R70_11120 [Methanoregula sp.]|nr:hypothetical protein [Methanoregula sp.]
MSGFISGRSYTACFDVMHGDIVNIFEVMTIEEAHKRDKRFRK